MAHDLHCECVESLTHCRIERERAERKMKALAAALFDAAPLAARLIVADLNAEGGVLINDPTQDA